MTKHIYKLNNRINGKAYVGQTSDLERRWREHRNSATEGVGGLLYEDMRKFGIANFTMEILEWNVEDYNERERYYISLYDTLYPKGYNKDKGGGWKVVCAADHIEEIIDALQNSEMQMQCIAKHFKIGHDMLTAINKGEKYRQSGVEYPIRDNDNFYNLTIDQIKQIHYSLQYELEKSLPQIQEEYGLTKATLYHINYGDRLIYQLPGKNYPLRDKTLTRRSILPEQLQEILHLLKTSDLSLIEISKRYCVSDSLIGLINKGASPYYVEGVDYPVRDPAIWHNRVCLSPNEVREVENALRNTDESIASIAKRYDVTAGTICNLNCGKIKKYFNPNLTYPIRPIKRQKNT